MESGDSNSVIRFGIFEVNLRARELRRRGVKVKVQDQPFQVLAMLLEKPCELVTREELRDRIWPAGIYVDYEKSLSKAVNKIREALGDSWDSSRFIETLPRRGYRFLVPVQSEVLAVSSPPLKPVPVRSSRTQQRILVRGAMAVLALAVLVGAVTWALREQHLRERGQSALMAVPLTTFTGQQVYPAFSPDGNQVAFAWDGPNQDNFDIYVKVNGSENLLRLTQDPAPDFAPAWSPDGRYIAFLRDLGGGHIAVMMIPSLGGPPERKLTEIRSIVDNPKVGEALPGLSWSLDGKWIAMKDRAPGEDHQSLYVFSVDSGEKRRLTFPPIHCGDGSPAFSPDGKSLAFSRTFTLGVSEVYVQDLSDDLRPTSAPKQLTFSKQRIIGLAWSPDGREIIYSSGSGMDGGLLGLRRVWRSGAGEPRILAFAGEPGEMPTISRRGNRLAFVRPFATDENIWRLDLSASKGRTGKAIRLIASTRNDLVPQYSPDGKKIVFISQRSGRDEVWECGSDGFGLVQLTSLGAAITGSPRWSPDGARIVFDSNAAGTFDVYVIDATGGRPKRLTASPADDAMALWSRDGHSIYFVSNRTKGWEIWKMPADGGEATQVTKNGGYVAYESVDGKFLYYTKNPVASVLWRMPLPRGEESQVLDATQGDGFTVVDRGIYFFRPPEAGGNPTLSFLNFDTGTVNNIASIPHEINLGLSVSPDRRYALYTQEDQVPGSDLMVIENFR